MKKPKVTVAIVCFNEEKKIGECLHSVLNQSYGEKNYEILVVDNNSQDNTLKIIRDLQKKTGRVRLVINPKRGIAISRNVVLRQAQGKPLRQGFDGELSRTAQGILRQIRRTHCKQAQDVPRQARDNKLLAFTDADCVVPKYWLENLVHGYLRFKKRDLLVVGVGGGNGAPQTIPFYQAHRIAMDTLIGSRNSIQARRFPADHYVNHIPCCNVLYEVKKVKEVGGFDDSFGNIAEDEDLTARLLLKGYRLVYVANAEIIHKTRTNFRSWGKNMLAYGKGRTWLLQKYPHKLHIFFVLPVLLVLAAPLSLPIYFPVIFVYSLYLGCKVRKPNLVLMIFWMFFVTHFLYGVGEIYGIFKTRPKIK